MDTLTVKQAKEMMIRVAGAIVAAEPYLTEVDTIIGDGDHGTGMKRGFGALEQMLLRTDFTDMRELFRSCGMELVKTMGGASGVLFGTLLISGAEELSGVQSLNLQMFADYINEGVKAVLRRGKAQAGQKTMVDALVPAATALETAAQKKETLAQGLRAAYEAAQGGVEATKAMQSGVGRSKNFREHTIGHPDPGAISSSLVFKTMYEYVNETP